MSKLVDSTAHAHRPSGRLLAILFAITLTSLAGVGRAQEPAIFERFPVREPGNLSPPVVEGQIHECALAVQVSGFVPKALVEVFANGTEPIGKDSPKHEHDKIKLKRPLVPGDRITATQTIGPITSGTVLRPCRSYWLSAADDTGRGARHLRMRPSGPRREPGGQHACRSDGRDARACVADRNRRDDRCLGPCRHRQADRRSSDTCAAVRLSDAARQDGEERAFGAPEDQGVRPIRHPRFHSTRPFRAANRSSCTSSWWGRRFRSTTAATPFPTDWRPRRTTWPTSRPSPSTPITAIQTLCSPSARPRRRWLPPTSRTRRSWEGRSVLAVTTSRWTTPCPA